MDARDGRDLGREEAMVDFREMAMIKCQQYRSRKEFGFMGDHRFGQEKS